MNHNDDRFQDMAREQNRMQSELAENVRRAKIAPFLVIDMRIFSIDAARTGDGLPVMLFTLPNGIQIAGSMQPTLARSFIRELEKVLEDCAPDSPLELPGS